MLVVLLEPVKGLALLAEVVGILLISFVAGVNGIVVVVILSFVVAAVVEVDVGVTAGIGSGLTSCTAVGLKSSVDTLTGTGDNGAFLVIIISVVDFC